MNNTENQNVEDKSTPSQEDVIKWMKSQISFKKVQLELQSLDTQITQLREQQAKSMMLIAQYSSVPEELEEHVITEEDIKNYPEISEQGMKVGETVKVPKQRGLKK